MRLSRLIALCLFLNAFSPANAKSADIAFPSEWENHALTYQFEESIHQAKLQNSVVPIQWALIILKSEQFENKHQFLMNKKSIKKVRDMALKLNSCHYAGLAMRVLILEAHNQIVNHNEINLNKDIYALYSEEMGRCERVFKKSLTTRLLENQDLN